MHSLRALLAASLSLAGIAWPGVAAYAAPPEEWQSYGHDAGGMRYSPLTQISPANVNQLRVAWTYHMRGAAPAGQASASDQAQAAAEGVAARGFSRLGQSEATPLVVNGVMYVSTPYRNVVALDAATGKKLWSHDSPGSSVPSLRGVAYWPGDGKTPAEIIFGTRDGLLVALDAKTGAAMSKFGENGVVQMRTPEVLNGVATAPLGMTSPPLIFKNLVITGSAVQEQPARGASGDIRAWDARTGKLVWTFHTVPRAGEMGNDTWAGDSWKARSGVNAWGLLTADVARGLLYVPLGAPAWDRYGGDRKGDNLFSSSVVALDAATGKYRWHFQLVHHDIWDRDLEAPPTLLDVNVAGKSVPAVAVVNKAGLFFLLNRVTGKPILPIEERAVAPSDAPGEVAAATQPFPVKTPAIARQSFSIEDVATVTPELEAYCRNWITSNDMQGGPMYTPLSSKHPTILFPGYQGGANWAGGAFDPKLGLFFINANNLGQVEQLTVNESGAPGLVRGAGSGRFSDQKNKLMCQKPPWGTLNAINVSTGEIAWQSTLGVSDNVPAAVAKTGRPSVGGPIVTAGGVVFIGGTDDGRFRAFDAKTGAELWTERLEASAHATPITYSVGGKQYVVVVATGGGFLESPTTGDSVVAYALP